MKGWELYSWPVDGEWHFTLAPGTNRAKTVDEITAKSAARGDPALVDVVGVDALATVLGRLAPGTDVLWVGGVDRGMAGTARPPADIVAAVERRGADLQVQVITLKSS